MSDEEKSNELTFLKGSFIVDSKGMYGIFYILLDTKTNQYEKLNLLVSHYRTSLDEAFSGENWANASWGAIEDFINHSRYKGDYADKQTQDIQESIENKLQSADIEIIVDFVKAKDIGSLDQKFYEFFRKAVGEAAIAFGFAFEKITQHEIRQREAEKQAIYDEQQQVIAEQKSQFEQAKQQIPSDGAIIDISLVLAPVSGKPIDDLKVGDVIMIRLDYNTPKGRYFANFLEIVRDDKILPIPGKVEKIEKGPTGEHFVLTKIQDGIYGRLTESEPVKIKLFDPAKDKPLKGKQLPKSEDKNTPISASEGAKQYNLQIYILTGALIVLIILVIFYIYIYHL